MNAPAHLCNEGAARRWSAFVKFRAADPRILPSYGDALIVAAKTHIGSIAVAHLNGLVFAHRKRRGRSDARVCLAGTMIGNAVETGGSAEPEISVQRYPTTLFAEVIAQVPLK